jgi:hypothetical protein
MTSFFDFPRHDARSLDARHRRFRPTRDGYVGHAAAFHKTSTLLNQGGFARAEHGL